MPLRKPKSKWAVGSTFRVILRARETGRVDGSGICSARDFTRPSSIRHAAGSLREFEDPEGIDGRAEALEVERAGGFGLRAAFDGAVHPFANEYLAGCSRSAEAGGEIRDGADGGSARGAAGESRNLNRSPRGPPARIGSLRQMATLR